MEGSLQWSGFRFSDFYHQIVVAKLESTNPKVQGIDGAVRSYVEYLYEVARAR